jgi:transposase
MANQLKMGVIDSIFTLHRRGWSVRRIARELGIHRETVARYLQHDSPGPKPAIAPIGSEGAESTSKPAIAPIGSEASQDRSPRPSRIGRPSDCEPYREVVLGWLELGLTAQRMYQDLVRDHGFRGSYYSVRRFVSHLQGKIERPVRRMECHPGDEVQVDFGRGAPLVDAGGSRRYPHVFRVVLSYSRKAYSEVVPRQTTEGFLRALENAFWHFGGVPQRVVLDNLKAAVSRADWYDPDLNPKVQSFALHYGTVFLPTKPRTPQHKGKVERGIGYVQDNALKGRTFVSLQEQNVFLSDWEQNVADTRVHGTTRRQVGKVFVEVERAALLPLPASRFPCFSEGQRTVNRDGHIEVERAYYSAPPEYLGRRLWVRWDGRVVRLFNQRFEQIALHVQHEAGRFSTLPQHIADEKISGVERGAEWLLQKVQRIGPQSTNWAESVIAARGVEGVRVVQGLLSLAKRYRSDQLERACRVAHSYRAHRLRTIRDLIDRDVAVQQEFDFMDEHPLIRPMSEYQQFVSDPVPHQGASG